MDEPAVPAATLQVRAPRADELEALLRFVAELNQPGPQHCLHLADTEAGVRADIERDAVDVGAAFLLAADADGWCGAVGVNRDGDVGWLFGPWSRDPADGAVRPALLRAALAAPGLVQVRAFADVRCDALIAELEAAGFVRHSEVHVMQARRPTWRDDDAASRGAVAVAEADDRDEPALAALHREAFPHTWLAGDELLAYARKHGAIWVARDAAQGLLGSLCLSVNPALPEADVEFVAVQTGARGRGIGRLLLHTALRHAFQAAQRDAVNLCVNDVNVGALRLYESCGFGRLYSGASLRWLRHGDEPATGAPAA